MTTNMRYAGLMKNDIVDGDGVCVSFWFQGCAFHCNNCHNPQTWDENGGLELPSNILSIIDEAIDKNGIKRNFSMLGGDPFYKKNRPLAAKIARHVKNNHPNTKIYIWSGYTYEELIELNDENINTALAYSDYLIDGRYKDELRDITLKLRGSSNQRIIDLKKKKVIS